MAVLNEGDEVLLPDPVYDAYQSPIRLAGGQIKPVASRIEGGRFVITEEALEAAWSPAARVLILNTPWNPVGTVLTLEELIRITQFCERRNLVLLSDEIYEAITYGECQAYFAAAIAPGLRDRCVSDQQSVEDLCDDRMARGLLRGAGAADTAMFMVLAQSSRGPATFVQDAAAEALNGPQDCVAAMRAEYARRRNQVLSSLDGIPVLRPKGVFSRWWTFAARKFPPRRFAVDLMHEFGVAVVHGVRVRPGRRRDIAGFLRKRRGYAESRFGSAAHGSDPNLGVAPLTLVQLSPDVDALHRELDEQIAGEVRFDRISRALYSTDASVYQIMPLGVVIPKTREDIVSAHSNLPSAFAAPSPCAAAELRRPARPSAKASCSTLRNITTSFSK